MKSINPEGPEIPVHTAQDKAIARYMPVQTEMIQPGTKSGTTQYKNHQKTSAGQSTLYFQIISGQGPPVQTNNAQKTLFTKIDNNPTQVVVPRHKPNFSSAITDQTNFPGKTPYEETLRH